MSGAVNRRQPTAFTLVEVLVVLVIAAALTAAAAVPLVSASRAAAGRDAAARLAAFDRLARERARRSAEPVWLVFDLNAGSVRREGTSGDGAAEASGLPLPEGYRIARLFLRRTEGGGPVVSGEVAVPLSSRGQSPSYAVLLQGPGETGRGQWVVVAGLSGRAVTVVSSGDESEVEQMFAALSAGGGDAR